MFAFHCRGPGLQTHTGAWSLSHSSPPTPQPQLAVSFPQSGGEVTCPVLLSRGLGRQLSVSWRRGCKGTAGGGTEGSCSQATCSALQVETLGLPPSRPGTRSLHHLTTPASRPKGLPLCLPPPLGLGLLPGPEWGHGRKMGYFGQEATGGQKAISAIPSQTGKAQRPGPGEQGFPKWGAERVEEAGDGAQRVGLNNPALLAACEPRVRPTKGCGRLAHSTEQVALDVAVNRKAPVSTVWTHA